MKTPVRKVISGGQTGADRAGLDAAIESSLPIGGWCPRGRRAEDVPIAVRYPLQETDSAAYRVRTELNVRDSDGTLVFTVGPPSGGTALTIEKARLFAKPCLVVDLERNGDPRVVEDWLRENEIEVLNIAGPRESNFPGIYERAKSFLRALFRAGGGDLSADGTC
ncbi:MAG: molybdenum cofactor carrier [Deltaproteobacteria bacterium]|nr:molybdenum cofactor carrier [Deltaproteobacteria bacterium]